MVRLFARGINYYFQWKGFPHSSVGKEFACNAGDPGSIPGSERSAGEGIGYPLRYSWTYLIAQLIKNPPAMRETWVTSLGWEDPWRRERLPTPVFWLGEFHGLYSLWGRKESDTTEWLWKAFLIAQLVKNPPAMQETLVRFLVREDPLKKEIHWRKDRLPILVFLGFPCGSTGKESARNAGDLGWEDPLGREWLPTPVFWPGEFHGLYSLWDLKESDRTEQLSHSCL